MLSQSVSRLHRSMLIRSSRSYSLLSRLYWKDCPDLWKLLRPWPVRVSYLVKATRTTNDLLLPPARQLFAAYRNGGHRSVFR